MNPSAEIVVSDFGPSEIQIAGLVDGEVVGSIEVFSSPFKMNQYLWENDLFRFVGLPKRRRVGYFSGIEIGETTRKQGTGRAVVSAMIQEAIRAGLSGIALASVPKAVGFWQKLGWSHAEFEVHDDAYLGLMIRPMWLGL